MKVVELPIETL